MSNIVYTEEIINDLAEKLLIWAKNPVNYWLGDFATDNGLWSQRLSEFAKKNENFAKAMLFAKQCQENRIAKGAMENKFSDRFAYNALKNVAGWRDQQTIDLKGEGVKIYIPEGKKEEGKE